MKCFKCGGKMVKRGERMSWDCDYDQYVCLDCGKVYEMRKERAYKLR